MKTAIIILNWNGADDSIECMDSLLAQKPSAPSLIVVDNNSSDNSVKRFKQYKKAHSKADIIIIENDKNIGFAGGINTGIKYAIKNNIEHVGILNPDATADKYWLENLTTELENNPKAGLAAGLLVTSDGKKIDSSGDFYSTWGLAFPRNRDNPISKAPTKPQNVFGATGGSVLYRTYLFEDIGLFDEDFFMYYEDVDISFRAQLRGYKVRYTPKALAYHKRGESTKKVPGLAVYNTFKNLPMLGCKNVPFWLGFKILPRFFLAYTLFFFSAIAKGNGWPALKGFSKSILLFPKNLFKRHKIQSTKIVSGKYINSIIYQGIPPTETGLRKLFYTKDFRQK